MKSEKEQPTGSSSITVEPQLASSSLNCSNCKISPDNDYTPQLSVPSACLTRSTLSLKSNQVSISSCRRSPRQQLRLSWFAVAKIMCSILFFICLAVIWHTQYFNFRNDGDRYSDTRTSRNLISILQEIRNSVSGDNTALFRSTRNWLSRNLSLTRSMSSSIDVNKYKLVVAGKMSLLGNECNIGQLNLITGQWNASECVQLNLYNSYSGGQVYYLLANQSVKVDHNYPYDVASINGFK